MKQNVIAYYFAVIYPFRILFKYGNVPRAQSIVPILTSVYLYLLLSLCIHSFKISSAAFVLCYILTILLIGIFKIIVFLNEEQTIEQIINLPKNIRTSSYYFYIPLILTLISAITGLV